MSEAPENTTGSDVVGTGDDPSDWRGKKGWQKMLAVTRRLMKKWKTHS